jgi:hypothetical protein
MAIIRKISKEKTITPMKTTRVMEAITVLLEAKAYLIEKEGVLFIQFWSWKL